MLGDIQVSLCERRGVLEVEIIRAKNLLMKPGAKTLPGMLLILVLAIEYNFCSVHYPLNNYYHHINFYNLKLNFPGRIAAVF